MRNFLWLTSFCRQMTLSDGIVEETQYRQGILRGARAASGDDISNHTLLENGEYSTVTA